MNRKKIDFKPLLKRSFRDLGQIRKIIKNELGKGGGYLGDIYVHENGHLDYPSPWRGNLGNSERVIGIDQVDFDNKVNQIILKKLIAIGTVFENRRKSTMQKKIESYEKYDEIRKEQLELYMKRFSNKALSEDIKNAIRKVRHPIEEIMYSIQNMDYNK